MFNNKRILAFILVGALVLFASTALLLGIESTTRVSSDSSNNQATGGASTNPSMTSGGKYVVFESTASNLISGGNTTSDVYRKDTSANTVVLISADTAGGVANGPSSDAAISATDGRYVSFQSTATDLITGGNATSDIYRRDTTAGSTILISKDTAGGAADGASSNPSTSTDGRYVVFESAATDLVTSDSNGVNDIFKRDATNSTTTLISSSSASVAGDGASSNAAISATDGRYIAFESAATNLVASDSNARKDIFLKDTTTNQTTRVSTATSGTEATGGTAGSTNASISANGRYIAFQSDETNLVSSDTNGNTDIFVKDTQTNTTTRVSTTASSAQSTGGNSSKPVMSSDSRFVAFTSSATNLVSSDTNGVADIFIKDTQDGTITRLSTSTAGAQANGASDNAAIASNGKYAAYDSAATNLVTGDTNGLADVFKAKIDTKAPSNLTISSSTHPSSSKYYKEANVALSWTATDTSGVAGYSYTMNKTKTTVPNTTSEGILASKTYTTHTNGAYYFHLRAVDVHGNWSGTKRFRVNIDRYKPRTYARKKYVAGRRRGVASARIYWRVADPYTGNKAYVKILIRKRVKTILKARYYALYRKYRAVYLRTKNPVHKQNYLRALRIWYGLWKKYPTYYNKTIKVLNYRWTTINKVRYYNWRVSSPGTYRYSVFSRDQAGNTQRNIAAGYVIVK